MKHKLTLGLVLLLVTALVIFATGCPKTTGGGWFLNEGRDDAKVTFGFNAQPTGDDDGAKGTFQLVDHSTKPQTRIHGTFEVTPEPDEVGLWQIFSGQGTRVTGKVTEPVDFEIWVWDLGEGANEFAVDDWLGDGISVFIDGELEYSGILGGGNIQVHKK